MISKAFLIPIVVGWVTGAHASMCIEPPFKTRVAGAQNIFVARITGGKVIESDDFPLKIPKVFATFEIVEQFKGTVPFDQLEASSAAGMGGIQFVVGAEYLIFAPDTGKVGSCSNDGGLSPAEIRSSQRTVVERDALRVVENNDFSNVPAPEYCSSASAQATQPFVECANRYPDGIEGTWGVDPTWTRQEFVKTHPDVETPCVVIGSSGSTTITRDSIVIDVPDIGQIERTYRLISSRDHRYTLEHSDKSGETEISTIVAVPCGLVMEAQYDCVSAFCTNARNEMFEMIADKIGGDIDADQLRRGAEEAWQRQRSPERLYYRQLDTEKPRTAK